MRVRWVCECGRTGLERLWTEARAKAIYHEKMTGHKVLRIEKTDKPAG